MKLGKPSSRRMFISVALVLALSLGTRVGFGFVGLSRVDSWPDGWPPVLESCREDALQQSSMGGEMAERLYWIRFRDRHAFEAVWPALLKLRSKGAPLHLHTAKRLEADPDGFAAFFEGPLVEILCPASGTYHPEPDGTYIHTGKWTQDLASSDGLLPEFVLQRLEDGKWIPVKQGAAKVPAHAGVRERARVELALWVDGEVIDLNRIKLPKSTPILDERTLGPQMQDHPQSEN